MNNLPTRGPANSVEPLAVLADRPDPPIRFQGVARTVLAIALLALGLWTIRSFIPALVWAAILAIATWPLYRRAEARWPPGRHNILLPALFTLAVALLVLIPLALAGLQIAREAHNVLHLMEQARTQGLPPPEVLSRLPFGAQMTAWWQTNLADPSGYADLVERMQHGSAVTYTRALGSQLVHRAVIFGFTLLTLFFLYREGDNLAGQMLRASQRAVGPHGERIGRQMIASVHGTLDGLVLVGLGEGVLIGVSYYVAHVPHPTLFGAATAIAAMIPFGAPTVFCVAGLLLVADGAVGAGVGVIVFGFAIVFLADHFVRPALIGGATKLPFIWVLFGIFGGVEAWGLLGLFLGPALMAALVLLWRDWASRRTGSTDLVAADHTPSSGTIA